MNPGLREWLRKNLEMVMEYLLYVATKISFASVAVIFDLECAKCTREDKLKKCFIPFLTSEERAYLYLEVIVYGYIYNLLKKEKLEELMRTEFIDAIRKVHEGYDDWKKSNCDQQK